MDGFLGCLRATLALVTCSCLGSPKAKKPAEVLDVSLPPPVTSKPTAKASTANSRRSTENKRQTSNPVALAVEGDKQILSVPSTATPEKIIDQDPTPSVPHADGAATEKLLLPSAEGSEKKPEEPLRTAGVEDPPHVAGKPHQDTHHLKIGVNATIRGNISAGTIVKALEAIPLDNVTAQITDVIDGVEEDFEGEDNDTQGTEQDDEEATG